MFNANGLAYKSSIIQLYDAKLVFQDPLFQNNDIRLMAWSKVNQRDPNAHAFTYPEIPKH